MLASILLSALALGLLWSGGNLMRWAVPTSAFLHTIERLPEVLLVLGVLLVGRWWRPAGFRAARAGTIRHTLPMALLCLYFLSLVAWGGRHRWLASAAEQAATAFWEEGLFRGVIMLLLSRRGPSLALFGSAALFAATHAFNVAEAPVLHLAAWELAWPFAFGLATGILRLRTASIWPPIALHFLVNVAADAAPAPLSWSGVVPKDLPAELALFAVLFVCCGLATLPRCRRAARVTTVGAFVGIAGLSAAGAFVLGGPRPGWEGPGWKASVSVRNTRAGEAWIYSYKLRFRSSEAEIVSFSLRIDGAPDVRDLRAVAGDRSWDGALEGDRLVWKGGVAPQTTYGFRCALPSNGSANFRIVYLDRYGWTREWEETLDEAPGE